MEEVLDIEREAREMVDRASAEARAIRAGAIEDARRLRERLLAEATRQAEEMVAAARAEAERGRDRRLAESDREIAELERSARRRIDEAVAFAMARLLGLPEVSPAARGQRKQVS